MSKKREQVSKRTYQKALKQRKERYRKAPRDQNLTHKARQDDIDDPVPIKHSSRKQQTLLDEMEQKGILHNIAEDTPAEFSGMVTEVYPRGALVRKGPDDYILCEVTEYLWAKNESPVAAGDIVNGVYVTEDYDYDGVIISVEPRSSVLAIPEPRSVRTGTIYEKILAANIDVFIVVDAVCSPDLNPAFIDRCLVVGQREGDKMIILCINKMDLTNEIPPEAEAYHEIVDHVVYTSAQTGQGIDELRQIIGKRKAVMTGRSGVGKSSVLNAMAPNLNLEALPVIRKSGKGAHTTRRYSLYEMPEGGMIIDTPGVKEISLVNISAAELTWYFPDFLEAREQCRFNDCTHTHEPGCGIKQAVEDGCIHQHRYESYVRLLESLEKRQPY